MKIQEPRALAFIAKPFLEGKAEINLVFEALGGSEVCLFYLLVPLLFLGKAAPEPAATAKPANVNTLRSPELFTTGGFVCSFLSDYRQQEHRRSRHHIPPPAPVPAPGRDHGQQSLELLEHLRQHKLRFKIYIYLITALPENHQQLRSSQAFLVQV